MKPEIKALYSFDVEDLETYKPPDPASFAFHLRLIAGPQSEPGEESFDMKVCTPNWLLENHGTEEVIIGRHLLIVMEYDYQRIVNRINEFADTCTGDTWTEVAEKLSRLGYWEFEDYTENPAP